MEGLWANTLTIPITFGAENVVYLHRALVALCILGPERTKATRAGDWGEADTRARVLVEG